MIRLLLSCFIAQSTLSIVSGVPKGSRVNSEWLKYSELQSLNATCAPFDSCSEPRLNDDLSVQTCECNSSCSRHKTCCIDSPYRDVRPSFVSSETCEKAFGTINNVFMITTCKPNWRGDPTTIQNCENKTADFSDPIGVAPATNSKTYTTYKNYFCAMCNDDEKDVKLWSMQVMGNYLITRKVTNSDDINDLTYDENADSWGFWELDEDGEWQFRYVFISFLTPQSPIVKRCQPNLISTCAPDWEDELIRKKCNSYMAAAYITTYIDYFYQDLSYHNPHCAICNHVTEFTDVCESRAFAFGGKPPLSFSLLLDVNRSDGNIVGVVSRCPGSQLYDPFFKKCRTVVCALRGHTVRNNKCVRI